MNAIRHIAMKELELRNKFGTIGYGEVIDVHHVRLFVQQAICHRVGGTTRREEFEFEFTFTLFTENHSSRQFAHSRSLPLPVRYPTDPWLRSRPPTRPYLSQGPISVQPRDVLATANLCYRRGLAVASGRAHRGALWGVSPSSSLVGR